MMGWGGGMCQRWDGEEVCVSDGMGCVNDGVRRHVCMCQ